MSPSISESLLKTPFIAVTFNVVSSNVVSVSATNVGVSFVGFTVISKVLVATSVPSETVYVAVGTTPLKLLAGTKV